MASRPFITSFIEYPLGTLGLVFIWLTACAAARLERGAPGDRLLAWLVLACVAAVGWTVDRLPRHPMLRAGNGGRRGWLRPSPLRADRSRAAL